MDKIQYWLDIADNDMKVAKTMVVNNHNLHAGFLCHLIAEKALKAVVASVTDETPPKTHHLMNLAVKGGVFGILSENHLRLLKELQPLQLEARYPDYKVEIEKTLTKEKTERIFKETGEFLCWIKQKLGR